MSAMPPPVEATATTAKTSPKGSKMHRRSRSGCFTCRLRRKKCSEEKPRCKACRHLGLDCEYKRPHWWSNNDARRKQKDLIKSIIKRTKTTEKQSMQGTSSRLTPPGLSHSVQTSDSYSDAFHPRASSEDSDEYEDYAVDPFVGTPGYYDAGAQQYFAPQYAPPDMYNHGGCTYEIDVKTERQMFVNDIPTRRDSSISTFSTFVPPPPHATLSSYTGDDFLQQPLYDIPHQEDWAGEEGLDFNFFDFANGSHMPQHAQTAMIPVDDCDRVLLDHLIDNVLPLVFPILEANQHGSVKSDVILPSLETNQAYLHSCLSAAAVHMKSSSTSPLPETIDGDILRHKFAFVQEVVSALGTDTNHFETLQATLGMIALQCVIGHANDTDKDIPWHQHFQAATELVSKLHLPATLEDLPGHGAAGHPPFNMTLTAWIDILGSTMLGRAPTFADTYRTKHLSASSTGLAELMGCQDNVMYLLSEVACLDALRQDKRLDDIAVCSHVQSLAQQLDATETPSDVPQSPYSGTGALRPRQLSRNITALFRKALRVYLCSLVPGYDRYGQATVNLVAQMTDLLQYIPSGPGGFDRSIVWPLLICGANSTPASTFRRVLSERIELLGDHAGQGSFGRMVRVLQETWRRNDTVRLSSGMCEVTPVTAVSPAGSVTTPTLTGFTMPSTTLTHAIPTKPKDVHWRDVMRENGWDFLLI